MRRWSAPLFLVLLGSCAPSEGVRSIPVAEYGSKVAGFWLGQLAGNIYGLSHEVDAGLELLPDGHLQAPVIYSRTAAVPEWHFYGYGWTSSVTVSALTYTVGFSREEWGWFRDARVEILREDGSWEPASGQISIPEPPDGSSKYLQPGFVTYAVTFDAVQTRGVRLAGWSGGHAVDGPPTFGTTLVELSVH